MREKWHKVLDFLFPSVAMLKREHKALIESSCESKKRIDDMMATLNGENDWFIERREGRRHGDRGDIKDRRDNNHAALA